MEGGVAVQAPQQHHQQHQHHPHHQQHGTGESQGFFHMPKLQVPNYQKSRVYIPGNNNFMHQHHPENRGSHSGPGAPQQQEGQGQDARIRQVSGGNPNMAQASSGEGFNVQFDGKRIRKAVVRKTVDYNTSVIKYLENRVWQRDWRDNRAIQPDGLYHLDITPPMDMQHKPMNCLTTKFMRQSTNKFRCPIFCLAWTPEGRRLVTGASSGEFTLWNGLTFSFETILQAHETSVRAMVWSHSDQWMVTGDHGGYIKYWQSNMNNVKMYQGHKEAIRSISFCPTDSKFASCSDDGTVRVWDFLHCHEEKILRGHGADVKCVDWHPSKSLIASGSKDNQVPIKLWDPKSGTSLATLHAHKFTVMDVKWNANGNWLLTASRDHLMKLFDIRYLKEELQVFKGHKKEATAIAWHPINEQLFASGGSDGAIMFWNAGTEKEVGAMEEAHDAIIWDLAWHPLGHVLASASNDHSTKFWSRNRPGDAMRDKYNLNIIAVGPDGEALDIDADIPLGEGKSLLPGMGLEFGLPPPEEEKPKKPLPVFGKEEEELPAIPGLDWQADAQYFREQQERRAEDRMPRKKTPYARPIPRSFEQAWITNQQPGTLVKDESDGTMRRGKIQSLLSLNFPDKPPPGLEYVDFDNDEDMAKRKNKGDPMNAQGPGGYYEEEGPEFSASVPPEMRADHEFRDDSDFRGDQDFRQDKDFRGDQDFRGGGGPGEMEFQQFNNDHGPGNEHNAGPPRGPGPEQSPGRGRGGPGQFRGHFRGGPPVNNRGGFHDNMNEDVARFEEMERENFGADPNQPPPPQPGTMGPPPGQGPPAGPGIPGPVGPPGQVNMPPPGQVHAMPPGQHGPPGQYNMPPPGQPGSMPPPGQGPPSQPVNMGGPPPGQNNMMPPPGQQPPGSGPPPGQFIPSGPSPGAPPPGYGGQEPAGEQEGQEYSQYSPGPQQGGYMDFDNQGQSPGIGGYDRGRGRGGQVERGRGGQEGYRGRGRGGGNQNQGYQQDNDSSGGGGGGGGQFDRNNDSEFQGGRGGYNRGRGNYRGGDRGGRGGRGRGRGEFRGRGRGRGGRGGSQ